MSRLMVRRVGWWFTAVLLSGCLSGCGARTTGGRPSAAGSPSAKQPPSSSPGGVVHSMRWDQTFHDQREADKVFTLANYEAIKTGMSYEELIAVLEIPAGAMRPDDDMRWVGPESAVELTWFSGPKKDRSITIKLKGKTVVEKTQRGLQ